MTDSQSPLNMQHQKLVGI